jgi:hypothetical protein
MLSVDRAVDAVPPSLPVTVRKTRPAVILRADEPPRVEPHFEPTLANLQAIVGDPIDLAAPNPAMVLELQDRLRVTVRSGEPGWHLRLVVHDDGHRLGLPVNLAASRLYGGPLWHLGQHCIVGHCVLVEVE